MTEGEEMERGRGWEWQRDRQEEKERKRSDKANSGESKLICLFDGSRTPRI